MTRRHSTLAQVFNEPEQMSPSLARAVGPRRLVSLAEGIGPGHRNPLRSAAKPPLVPASTDIPTHLDTER